MPRIAESAGLLLLLTLAANSAFAQGGSCSVRLGSMYEELILEKSATFRELAQKHAAKPHPNQLAIDQLGPAESILKDDVLPELSKQIPGLARADASTTIALGKRLGQGDFKDLVRELKEAEAPLNEAIRVTREQVARLDKVFDGHRFNIAGSTQPGTRKTPSLTFKGEGDAGGEWVMTVVDRDAGMIRITEAPRPSGPGGRRGEDDSLSMLVRDPHVAKQISLAEEARLEGKLLPTYAEPLSEAKSGATRLLGSEVLDRMRSGIRASEHTLEASREYIEAQKEVAKLSAGIGDKASDDQIVALKGAISRMNAAAVRLGS